MTTEPKPRWYAPTPGKMIAGLLVVELCLFAADRLSLFGLQRGSGWNVIAAVAIFLFVILAGLVWFLAALILKKRFQFSVLTLFGLMCVVAVVGGWFGWKMERARRQAAVVAAIEKMGGSVTYDYEYLPVGVFHAKPIKRTWFRKTGFVSDVLEVRLRYTDLDDTNAVDLGELPRLRKLDLSDTQITDAGLVHIGELPELETLTLAGTEITDRGRFWGQSLNNE